MAYERLGETVPFYATAILAAVCALPYCAYYVYRLARTSSGLLGGLKAAEDELWAQRSRPTVTVSPTTVTAAVQ